MSIIKRNIKERVKKLEDKYNNIEIGFREMYRVLMENRLNELGNKYNISIIQSIENNLFTSYYEIKVNEEIIYSIPINALMSFVEEQQSPYQKAYNDIFSIEDKIKIYLYDKEREVKKDV